MENKYQDRGMRIDPVSHEIVGTDNIRSKKEEEKLLFGETNAEVEFFVEPSFEGEYGLRVLKDSSGTSFLLEVKRFVNWEEAWEQASRDYPTIGIPMVLMPSMPENIQDLIGEHNMTMLPLQREQILKLYRVGTQSVPISNRFAKKMHARFRSFIQGFKGGELHEGMMGDGETTVFRTLTDQEVWTLVIDFHTENEARRLSDLCKQIIADVEADSFEEAKYIGQLESD